MTNLDTALLTVDDQQAHPDPFPLVVGLRTAAATMSDVVTWIATERRRLIESLSLYGAVLFRGFPVHDANEFDAFIRAFALESFTYEESLSNAVRVNCTELVFTANEAPPDVSIYLHHEMAQTPLFPSRLFFFCEKAPRVDGQTPICRSDVLLERLAKRDPEFVEACSRLGVCYSNVMPAQDDPESGQGRSWRSTLGVDGKVQAEERLGNLGYRFEWLENDALRTTTAVLPAIRTLVDGRRVFFNQLIAAFRGWKDVRNAARKSICFGDDSDISPDSMQIAIELADELSFDIAWQPGDVALVDNFLVMHGRRPFAGERRVLASLVADDGTRLTA